MEMRAIRWGGAALVVVLLLGVVVVARTASPERKTVVPAAGSSPKGKLVIAGFGSKMLIRNYNWGIDGAASEAGTGAGSGKAVFLSMDIEKLIDENSVDLADAVTNGNHFQTATVTVFKPGTTDALSTFKLSDAIVTDVRHSYKSVNVETISLGYRTIEWTYRAPDADQVFCWQLDLNAGC
jgi:type VI secretion system Hcp family effector